MLKYRFERKVEVCKQVERFKSSGRSVVPESRSGQLSFVAYEFAQIKRG
jgi:hypothetical protein